MSTSSTNIATQHAVIYRSAVATAQLAQVAALSAGLTPRLLELVKIRVSQINGCAFCLRTHTADAIKHGESVDRLAVLSAWRETSLFDRTEDAALDVAERVTNIGLHGAHRRDDGLGLGALTDEQASAVAWTAVAINTFNRIALTSGYPVELAA